MVGWVRLWVACWRLGRARDLFRATAQAREGAAAAVVAESVVGIVAAALNNKARDMFALILGLPLMVDYMISNVVGSMRGSVWLTGPSMTDTP
jgi:hypothetical protein